MEYRRDGDEVAIRLDLGDEIASAVAEVCRKEGVQSASFSAIGACSKAEISHYDTVRKEYRSTVLEGMLEIVSLLGNVTFSDGAPLVHAHVAFGLPDFSVQGGHLVRALVKPTCEISMRIRGIGVSRALDAASGLRLQRF